LLGVLGFYVWTLSPPERALWAVVAAVWAVGVFTLTWEHYKPTWLIMSLIMVDWAGSVWRKA